MIVAIDIQTSTPYVVAIYTFKIKKNKVEVLKLPFQISKSSAS